MASEWPWTKLGDVVINFDSQRVPLSAREREKRRGRFPYYGATGVMDHVDDYLFEGMHLLVAEDGSVETDRGAPFLQLVDGRFWVNNHAHVIKGETDKDTRYLFYALSTIQIRPFMTGSVQAKLSQGNLNRIAIPYPSRSEQRAIAAILGALDDKIELNHQMNQTLEAMAQALFKSWFVDFEPFRDKGMQESKLGPIPRGWKAGELNNIANFVKGVSYRSDDLQESTVALVTLKSVARGGGYQQEGLKPYIGEYKSEQQLQPGEVIVAHTDLTQAAEVLGRAARVQAHPQFPTLVASLDLVIVRSVGYAASSEFLYSMLSRSEFQEHAYSYANGTTVLHLSIKALPEYQCVLPPSEVVDDFTRLVRPLYQCIDSNESQLQSLAAIRDILLPKLLSGEIRVKDAEKFVEKVI